jgi:uncharacterized SAM-binding protein YcdF (DUF218 family)
MLRRDHVSRIALVTDASHMPRALGAFERNGLFVVPAPIGYVRAEHNDLMEWLPSTGGLQDSHGVLREWLALQVARLTN